MATNIPQNEAIDGDGTMDYTYITPDKLQYNDTKYTKVTPKLNDSKCDIKLRIQETDFKAHKTVLAKGSDYFLKLFKANKAKGVKNDNIRIKDITPKGFQAMLEYFYNGHVTIENGNIKESLEACRFLKIDWMLDCCRDFLVRHLSVENYKKTTVLAEKYGLGDLNGRIFHFLGKNLTSLSEQEDFYKKFSYDLLYQFLRQNVYVDACEFFILDLVDKWVNADVKTREPKYLTLLKEIRFATMEPEEIEDVPDLALKYPAVQDALVEARQYLYDVSSQSLQSQDKYLQRGARPMATLMTFSPERNVIIYKDFFNPLGGCAEELADTGMDIAFEYMGQAVIGNFLYACGGYDNNQTTNRMYRFDSRTRSWTELVPMKDGRASHAICSSAFNLVVMGGIQHITEGGSEAGKEDLLYSVECYDPKENTWSNLPKLLKCTFDSGSAYLHHTIYLTGGISTDQVPLNDVYSLQIGSDQWRKLAPMKIAKQAHSLTAIRDRLFAIGGYSSPNGSKNFTDCRGVECYDPETNQWTELKTAPDEFGHLQRFVAVFNDSVYMVGGDYYNRNLHKYNTVDDSWEEGHPITIDINRVVTLKVAIP